jgi:hypothetical protein
MTPSPAPATTRRWPLRIVAIVLLLAVLAIAWATLGKPQQVASFERPDHHYKVIVTRRSTAWPAAMPGQAGDAPGFVRLYDRSGRLLQETRVDMVQIVEGVDWQDRRAVIKLVADWPLPD